MVLLVNSTQLRCRRQVVTERFFSACHVLFLCNT